MDARRRQWVPMATDIAFSRTGTRLLDKWGAEGLLTWLLYLAACKRAITQGEFVYTSDEDGWQQLGHTASGFTLDEFFKYTGELKQTRRRRLGDVKHTVCTQWGDWNERYKRDKEAERSSRKRAQNMVDETPTMHQRYADDTQTDRDSNSTATGSPIAVARPLGDLPFDEAFGAKSTKSGDALTDLLAVVKDGDENTEAVFRNHFGKLPEAAYRTALEGLTERRARSDMPVLVSEAKYVFTILRRMLEEGQYA